MDTVGRLLAVPPPLLGPVFQVVLNDGHGRFSFFE